MNQANSPRGRPECPMPAPAPTFRQPAWRRPRLPGLALPLCLLTLLSACQPAPEAAWSGYAEGDYVYIAAPVAGTLRSLPVQKGQTVAAQALLFSLDDQPAQAARAEADARLDTARHQVDDSAKGRRRDEIAVTEAQLAQARAQASRRAAAQAREQALWREQQARQYAPAAGLVADTFFRVGEYVNAGQPVLALLPPERRKARFYVPEDQRGALAPGQAVSLHCDGCGAPMAARISYISPQAEYTPPVIYSNSQRARLVFLVEALPSPADALRLPPGQPLRSEEHTSE